MEPVIDWDKLIFFTVHLTCNGSVILGNTRKTRNMKINGTIVFTLLLTGLLMSCGETKKENSSDSGESVGEAMEIESPEAPEPTAEMKTVVDIALDDPRFSTLGKGLKSAELIDALEGMDSLTLFAPTNDAFKKLPEEMVRDLMAPQGRDKLTNVLKYHAVKGIYDSEDLKSSLSTNRGLLMLETLEGSSLSISMTEDGPVLMDDNGVAAKIIETDIQSEKGIVHVIDAVMLND